MSRTNFVRYETQSPRDVQSLFNRIAKRYDLLNRLLSFGQDVYWRIKVSSFVPKTPQLKVLDLATGTADLALFLVEKCSNISRVVGVDVAEQMLAIGNQKIKERGLSDQINLQQGDATQLTHSPNSFDVCTIAFGIRNMPDVSAALNEMYRVLNPGGRVLILEFSQPANSWLRYLYLFYLRHILPPVGSWLSRDSDAYRYLNRTIESFPYGDDFCHLMRNAHFSEVKAYPMTMGVVTLYYGIKQ